MYIRDKIGSFEIIVDRDRRVVHEKLSGLFTCEDSDRLEREYKNNVIPYLGEGSWMKLCDMTDYILNTSVSHNDINSYLKRLLPYGFIGCAVIIPNVMIKNYLSLAIRDLNTISFTYFLSEHEADEYLRKLGF